MGRYRIVARLGAGGMGRVYLARSPGGRPVAVKMVRTELAGDGDFRRRFAREVSAARRVNGAFTAGVIDAEPDGSVPWLATVYVPGVSLGEAVSEHGPWPEPSVRALGAGLAEALEAIHAAGVVHRDLKPSNVLLAADGPRVIDFGISVAGEAGTLTATGSVIGTPGFMSPEQLTGRPVGPASDIFALGAVLAYTATGVGPFGTGTPHALHFRAVYEQPDLSSLPAALRPVVAACLAKQPDQRPTVPALLDRLTTAGGEEADGATVCGAPPPTETGWMPEQVAQVVRERNTRTSLLMTSGRASADPDLSEAPEAGRAPGAGPRRRRKPALVAGLGVALAAAAILVIVILRGGGGSGREDDQADGATSGTSRNSSSGATETARTKPAHVAKLPDPCQALSRRTVERLVPNAKEKGGSTPGKNTAGSATCYWNGLEDNTQFRWLDVVLRRHDSGTAPDDEKSARGTYAEAITEARATEGARNVRTEPLSGIGDEATAVTYDLARDGDDFKQVALVVRLSNAVISVHYNGAGFEGAAGPDRATMTRGARTAAEETVQSVIKANT
ncbi:serine/threonine-protein kinase [Streptomyces sp. I05A-00742]|uniref:serine/threonine-protein kinase n=1 Tax=Streptomyces sp. I05A-00742 TaxID=2732853 RepID=UPI002897FC3D|nr:serine/threonine-protein kinase [Streptomyces sp. I05A-00742]